MDRDQLIGGRYRLARVFAAAPAGECWQAEDEQRQRLVVVEPIAQRWVDVARAATRFGHPNAIGVLDVIDDGGRPYVVTPFVAGPTLAQQIAGRVLDPAGVAPLLTGVADALAGAHGVGIVHRDVRPSRIVIDPDGRALLAGFGAVRGDADSLLTGAGTFLGTPAFLAPELARGGDASPAGDVYALGATLFAAFDGRAPFDDGSNPLVVLSRLLAGPVPPPRNAGPLTGLIMAMLAPDPWARPSAAQVAAALADPTVLPAAPPPGYGPPPDVVDPFSTLAGAIGHSAQVTQGWSGDVDAWEAMVVGELGPVLDHGDRVDLFVPSLFGLDDRHRGGLPRQVIKALPGLRAGVTIALADRFVCGWTTDSRTLAHISITLEYDRIRAVTPAALVLDGASYQGVDVDCGDFVWPIMFAPQPGLETLSYLLGGRPSGAVEPQWDADRVASWVVPDGNGGSTSVPGWGEE